jgi:hypothetical protein
VALVSACASTGAPRANTAARRRENPVWCMAVTCGAKCRGERESRGGVTPRQRRAVAGAAFWAAGETFLATKKPAGKSGRTFCSRRHENKNAGRHGPGHFGGPKIILNGREMPGESLGEPRNSSALAQTTRPGRPNRLDRPDSRLGGERVPPPEPTPDPSPERTPPPYPIRHAGGMRTDT